MSSSLPNQGNNTNKKGAKEIFLAHKYKIITILSLLVVATVCFFVIIPYFSVRAPEDAVIRIPKNATSQNVKDSIAKYLGEEYAGMVLKAASTRKTDYSKRHGAYLIEKGMTPYKAERKLAVGGQHPVKLVINGFRTPDRMAEKISLKMDFTKDSLLNAMQNPAVLSKYGIKKEEILALFPDATYEVFWSFSPEEVIDKTASHYKSIWNDERLKKLASTGLSKSEFMTLCSIVDEESNKADDKGKIGRLYLNRLKKGMKLQADPTVKYAVGDFTLRRILNQHLKTVSPYNTYLVTGLPPGPIRTTSVATIDSVLYSAPNDYLYMCAKEDFSGYHAFAVTYDEHLKNARRYQQALNERGIK